MNPKILRRFIFLMVIFIVIIVVSSDMMRGWFSKPPGDMETELGTQRMEDGLYDEALAYYDEALSLSPDHRGAIMGRALVFIQREQFAEAVAELDYLIEFLDRTLAEDDTTGLGVLAAAYANRGIVLDRQGEYKKALDSYIGALKTDEGAVEGPGWVDKILYGTTFPSTVRDRAKYIYEQLKLPEQERLLRVPELDAMQRMHRP